MRLRHRLTPAAIRAWLAKQPWLYRNWGRRSLYVFGISRDDAVGIAPRLDFARNHQADLERFEQTEPYLTGAQFLALAEERRSGGADIYTRVEDGKLAAFGWVSPGATSSTLPYVEQTLGYPPGSATILGDYVHPAMRGRGLHTELHRFRIRSVFGSPEARFLFLFVEGPNAAARASTLKAGYRLQARLMTRFRFGHRDRVALVEADAYPLRFDVPVRAAA